MVAFIVNAATLTAIYTIFSLGLSMVWGSLKIVNFAFGGIFVGSALVCYEVLRSVHLSYVVLLLLGTVVGAAMSCGFLLIVLPVLTRVRDPAKAEFRILTAGIGVGGVLVAVVNQETGGQPFSFAGLNFNDHIYHVFGGSITTNDIIILVLAFGLTAAVAYWIRGTRSGLALRALGVDAETAALMGINPITTALLIMSIAGALAGLAGVLLTLQFADITAASANNLLVKAFAVVILGGVGSILGSVVGALVLAVGETSVLTYTSGSWVDAISFGLILIILLLRPRGLFGRQEIRRT